MKWMVDLHLLRWQDLKRLLIIFSLLEGVHDSAVLTLYTINTKTEGVYRSHNESLHYEL